MKVLKCFFILFGIMMILPLYPFASDDVTTSEGLEYLMQVKGYHGNFQGLLKLPEGIENAADYYKKVVLKDSELASKAKQINKYELKAYAWNDPAMDAIREGLQHSKCSFYPEVYSLECEMPSSIPVPNFLAARRAANSFIIKGKELEEQKKYKQAIEMYRNVVILGWHFEQDRITVLQELVAVALISSGAQELTRLYRSQKDFEEALLWNDVIQECSQYGTMVEKKFDYIVFEFDEIRNELSAQNIHDIIQVVTKDQNQEFRIEFIVTLTLIKYVSANEKWREKAAETLEKLTQDTNKTVAEFAKRCNNIPCEKIISWIQSN